MKKQHINRQYNFPDADLYLYSIDAIKLSEPDIHLFAQYGYDLSRLETFANKCRAFSTLPNDDELLGDQMVTTEKKDAASENLKSAIRSLMTRVKVKYSNRSGRYRKFGTAKMGDMSDAQLLFCGRRVVRVARAQADFLADVGVNENALQRIIEACKKFETALNIQQDKIADRDISVEKRIERGNDIYKELVTLCNIGKDIWAERDIIKYDKYCIYESNNDQKIARKEREKENESVEG